jgi:sugar transferase (PEP-CTERM system associated)
MIRLFSVYYPKRTLARVCFEVVLVAGSFLCAALLLGGPDVSIPLLYENGLLKIAGLTAVTLLLTHYFDLYEPQRFFGEWEVYFRLLLVLSGLSFLLAGLLYLDPAMDIRPNVFVCGVVILATVLLIWRVVYEWACSLALLREKVFVLGHGDRARTVGEMVRNRRDSGMEVIAQGGIAASDNGDGTSYADELRALRDARTPVDRVIVAIEDRRGSMPLSELLDLHFRGVMIDDANSLIERLEGKLLLDGLVPSTFMFGDGFGVRRAQRFVRRIVSIGVSLIALLICLPIIPIVMLAVRISSPGPIFFRQTRIGLRGKTFSVIKFRTMREDAEANGAVWAVENDARVTRVGRFLRMTRLDEIPQMWNVLRGDMAFVGPRPERPEFVKELRKEIPFYELRHIIRPGITGWAQVRYRYGASLEETKRKLEYDLYYIKHLSLGLDLLIMFETIKTIILRRGAQ